MKLSDTELLVSAVMDALEELARPGKAHKARLRKLIDTRTVRGIVATYYPARIAALTNGAKS